MPAAAPGPADGAPRLTREDWLAAAHAAVVRGGFDQVKVLALARALGVTRGSFYWHFASQAELVEALVAQWQARQQALEQALRASLGGDPVADLQRLLDMALAQVGDERRHMTFALALRGLARRRPAVARVVAEVDASRLRLFGELFARLPGGAAQARDRATLFYLALAGSHQALSGPNLPPGLKDHLRGVIARQLVGAAGAAAPRRPALKARARRGSS